MNIELGIWEIAVLALLRQGPMHPYLMQRLLRERHKDEILALKKGSLYHSIRRLERTGLIEAVGTEREGRRPERTTYRIRAEGESALLGALRRIISMPRRESSEFMAAMSFLVHLTPQEAVRELEERAQRLEREICEHTAQLAAVKPHVGRIHLIESEYLLTVQRAELEWTRTLAADLRAGRLDWDVETVLKAAGDELRAAGAKEETSDAS